MTPNVGMIHFYQSNVRLLTDVILSSRLQKLKCFSRERRPDTIFRALKHRSCDVLLKNRKICVLAYCVVGHIYMKVVKLLTALTFERLPKGLLLSLTVGSPQEFVLVYGASSTYPFDHLSFSCFFFVSSQNVFTAAAVFLATAFVSLPILFSVLVFHFSLFIPVILCCSLFLVIVKKWDAKNSVGVENRILCSVWPIAIVADKGKTFGTYSFRLNCRYMKVSLIL